MNYESLVLNANQVNRGGCSGGSEFLRGPSAMCQDRWWVQQKGWCRTGCFVRPGNLRADIAVGGEEAWLALAWRSKRLAGSRLCRSLGSSKVTNEEFGKLPRAL